ncbi:type I polyketide synthase [Actibacterium sp. D379-3]
MTAQTDDIAIVGMAGLYPGADDIDVFWSNILNKTDAVTTSSEDWLGDDYILDPDSDDPLKIYTRKGGFLGDLSRFDAMAHGTVPRSVEGGQPDQFLALKLAYDALRDAGYTPGKFDGRATGVILGHSVHAHRGNSNGMQQVWFHNQTRSLLKSIFPDLAESRIETAIEMMQAKMPHIATEAVPGLVPNILSGRIANRLDLMGPNYIIDAACSSSIIATDLAINELRAGRADMMLAGGVNTTTSPLVYSVFCSVNALSRDGLIRPFDKRASGTVLGEGAGMIVMKRLADAQKAGDRIYAVIKGIGQSSDGKSSGLMAPRLEGEILAIERAYHNCGLDPASIGLVEAHGTGIPLGERTELEALKAAFGSRHGPLPTVPIGSVKSMIGHCIPASGSAAIIKMALSLQNKIIPPTLCEEVNDGIGLEDTPFYVSTEARPWIHSADTPRRAAINAFGFGGINAHMVLEEAPGAGFTDPTAAFTRPAIAPAATPEHVFAFAGADRAQLLATLESFGAALQADGADFASLAQSSWETAANHAGPERLSIVASAAPDFAKKLATAQAKLQSPETRSLQTRNGIYFEAAPVDGKVAFLFPGEMAQYPGMMADVAMAYPMVREWFDFIGQLTEGQRFIRLGQVAFPPPSLVDAKGQALLEELIHRVDYGSEMVFAADQAVHGLLTSLGIRADAMLGHSTGENAALVASGLLDLDRGDIGNMIRQMNVIFREVEESGSVPTGVLLTIAALDAAQLHPLIAAYPEIHFTMDNCPNQAILFGSKDQIDALEAQAVALGAVCTRLPISWGYHTEYVAPMAEKFGKLFEGVTPVDSPVTLYSCATATPFPTDRDAFRERAVAQYVSRVRFTEAVNQLYEDGHRIFIECGPNANLTAFVRDILGNRPHLADSADNRRRGMVSQLRHLVARLFTAGLPLEADAFLAPPQSADQIRRAEMRTKYRKAAALPSHLPYVRLDEAEARAIRDLIAPEPAPAAPAPQTAAPSAPAYTPVAAPQPQSAQAGVNGHIDLMTAFLKGQEQVARGALGAPALTRAAAPADPDAKKILVLDLARDFQMPFDFRAYLLRGAPSFAGMLPYLGAGEQDEARQVAEKARSGQAWAEWSLSRLAVKRAAGELMANGSGQRPQDSLIEVRKHDGGAPYLQLVAGAGIAPAISISHVNALGIGAAADPRWRLGIDYELPGRVRDPGAFLDSILGTAERQVIRFAPTGQTATTVWSIKEAAAKALGVGIQGRPQEFSIVELDPALGTAHVAYGAHNLEAKIRRVGDGICAVAFIAAAQ